MTKAVLLAGGAACCAAKSGVPSAEGSDFGKRSGPAARGGRMGSPEARR